MKNSTGALRIFNMSHPLMQTELLSLSGDKYRNTLPFSWEVVSDLDAAQVIIWDGVLSPKARRSLARMTEALKESKVLLLMGESMTLLKGHPMAQLLDLEGVRYVEVPGLSILPEEILQAIDLCHRELNHV